MPGAPAPPCPASTPPSTPPPPSLSNPQVNSDAPDAAFRATQVASQNAMFTAYPSTPEFLYVGANTGRGR